MSYFEFNPNQKEKLQFDLKKNWEFVAKIWLQKNFHKFTVTVEKRCAHFLDCYECETLSISISFLVRSPFLCIFEEFTTFVISAFPLKILGLLAKIAYYPIYCIIYRSQLHIRTLLAPQVYHITWKHAIFRIQQKPATYPMSKNARLKSKNNVLFSWYQRNGVVQCQPGQSIEFIENVGYSVSYEHTGCALKGTSCVWNIMFWRHWYISMHN